MKRAYIYTTPHPTKIRESMDATFDMATPKQRAAKFDIADFLLDAASRNNPVVGAANVGGQLAECKDDFSNKIP